MNDEPCKDGIHSFIIEHGRDMKCERCPITLTYLDFVIAGSSPNKLIEIVKQKEKNWFAKELES